MMEMIAEEAVEDAVRELELKFDLSPDAEQDLLRHPLVAGRLGPSRKTESVYYDTDANHLRKAGLTLRVRGTDGRFVQTVKADAKGGGGLFDRTEWEVPVAGPAPDFDSLPELAPLRREDVRNALRPIFATSVHRRTAVIDRRNGRVEFVLDEGQVIAGSSREALLELELELIEGEPAALFDVADELQSCAPLQLGVLSKSERGERLSAGKSQHALKSEFVGLASHMTVWDAFGAIAVSCLRHFRTNAPLVVGWRDADALHQSRVALRRLRAAFSLFRPVLDGATLDRFREQTRALAIGLGHARNLDVLIKRRSEELAAPLRYTLTRERERAYDDAISVLQQPESARMILALLRWIALDVDAPAAAAKSPIKPFADEVLRRYWKKVKRRGRNLIHIDDSERHELRIACKKLRYAGEFFVALYDEGAQHDSCEKFLSALEDLQDRLGALNDLATEQEMAGQLRALGLSVSEEDGKKLRARRKALLKASEAAFHRLARVDHYWRTDN